jgi:hypothetical protein
MRYSKQRLKEMAGKAIEAKNNGDYRYLQLSMTIAIKTGLSPESVDKKIKQLALTGGEK